MRVLQVPSSSSTDDAGQLGPLELTWFELTAFPLSPASRALAPSRWLYQLELPAELPLPQHHWRFLSAPRPHLDPHCYASLGIAVPIAPAGYLSIRQSSTG